MYYIAIRPNKNVSGSPAWSIFLPNDDTQTDINQRHTVTLIINTHKNLENYTMKEKI